MPEGGCGRHLNEVGGGQECLGRERVGLDAARSPVQIVRGGGGHARVDTIDRLSAKGSMRWRLARRGYRRSRGADPKGPSASPRLDRFGQKQGMSRIESIRHKKKRKGRSHETKTALHMMKRHKPNPHPRVLLRLSSTEVRCRFHPRRMRRSDLNQYWSKPVCGWILRSGGGRVASDVDVS